MTDRSPAPITYPREARTDPFDPPAILGKLRDEAPLRPMTFAGGHPGWLATGYSAVRALMADPRVSAKQELLKLPVENEASASLMSKPADPGVFVRMDPPEQTRYRRPLIAEFTVKRLKQLEPRIAEVTKESLDAMEAAGPPTDLVTSFAMPIPSHVICELLGVAYEDRVEFQHSMALVTDSATPPEEVGKAYATMLAFFPPLIESKRREPSDDLFSGLVNGTDWTDEELTNVGLLLFAGGFESTMNMLALGTFALLQNPEQAKALRTDPALADKAVEELMRFLSIVHLGPMRAALEDMEIEGVQIKKGDAIMLSFPAANRDPAKFENPDQLDISRSAQGHVAFGHGVHQCLGQQLARMEMRIAYPALFARFPELRLDVAPEEIQTKQTSLSYGVQKLPVAW